MNWLCDWTHSTLNQVLQHKARLPRTLNPQIPKPAPKPCTFNPRPSVPFFARPWLKISVLMHCVLPQLPRCACSKQCASQTPSGNPTRVLWNLLSFPCEKVRTLLGPTGKSLRQAARHRQFRSCSRISGSYLSE